MTEERCLKQPSHSWIFLASLGEFARASHSCCTPSGGFCFLFGKTITIFAQNVKKILGLFCNFFLLHVQIHACLWAYIHQSALWEVQSTDFCTNLGNFVPTTLQSQRALCAASQGYLAWSADDQWEKGLDGLESRLSVWSSTPTGTEQSRQHLDQSGRGTSAIYHEVQTDSYCKSRFKVSQVYPGRVRNCSLF